MFWKINYSLNMISQISKYGNMVMRGVYSHCFYVVQKPFCLMPFVMRMTRQSQSDDI